MRRSVGFIMASTLGLSLVGFAGAAQASTATSTITYSGSDSQDKILFSSPLIYVDGCEIGIDPITCFPDSFPGTLWAHIEVGIHTTVVTATVADLTLQAPDTFRQDSQAPFSTTLITKNGAGKEVKVTTTPWVQVQAAYDAVLANCNKNHVTVAKLIAGINTAPASECVNIYFDSGRLDIGTFTLLNQDAVLPHSGTGTVSEGHDSPSLTLVDLGIGSLGVHLHFDTNVIFEAIQGFTATRVLSTSSDPGTPLASDTLNWPDAGPQADTVTIPCGAQAGDNLVYQLNDNQWGGNSRVDVGASAVLEVPVVDDITLASVSANIFDLPVLYSGAPPVNNILGTVQAENKPPTVNLGPVPTDGVEGSPIALSAVGAGPGGSFDNCDAAGDSLDFAWTFDDGAKAFGKNVFHAFNDNNGGQPHSGQLVITDAAGNKQTKNFSVNVANATPVANAGPSTSAAWGRPVSFNGSAVDPGSVDQSTLSYSWQFGDGAFAGGASTVHSYATPGSFTARLVACDKDGACSTAAERTVTVVKRGVVVSYTGDLTGTYDTAGVAKASLVDQYGNVITGRSVGFTLNGSSIGSALTDSAGNAVRPFTTSVDAGSYPLVATFAGDGLYESASDSNDTIVVGLKSTTLTYTGPVTGGANKTVTLSAVLKDASGKPLAGRVVKFVLGTQTVSATTDLSGTASWPLKLSQKNGTYSLTAAYVPAAADVGRFKGSSSAVTFKLQAR